MVGLPGVTHLNISMEEMKAAIIRQLQAGEVVWFGSDVGHDGARQKGIWDDRCFPLERLKGMKVYAAGPASVNAYVNSEGKAVGQMELRLDEIEFLSKVFGTEQNESPAEPDDIEALL